MYGCAGCLLVLCSAVVLASPALLPDRTTEGIQPRGSGKKAVLPLLMGVVLKVSTLIPMSLMFMTFVALSAFFAAKLALGLVAAVGAHSLWRKAEKNGPGAVGHSAVGHSAVGGAELNELAAGLPQHVPGTRRRHVKRPYPFAP